MAVTKQLLQHEYGIDRLSYDRYLESFHLIKAKAKAIEKWAFRVSHPAS